MELKEVEMMKMVEEGLVEVIDAVGLDVDVVLV